MPDDTDTGAGDETDYESFAHDLEPLERELLSAAIDADDVGIGMLGRLLETWAYTLARCRCDLTAEAPPGTLVAYLDAHDDYEPSEKRTDGAGPHGAADVEDGDGGQTIGCPKCGYRRETTVENPALAGCPECGAALEYVDGEPRTDGGHLPSDRPTSSLSLDTHTDEDVYPDGGRRFNTQPVTCPECDGPLVNGECETAGCPGPDDVDGGEN